MTRAELISKSEAIQKSAKKVFLPLLAYLLSLATFLWWANFHKNIISEEVSGIIILIGFFGMYVVLFATAGITAKQSKRFGCACPNCKKELRTINLRIAIASGRCGFCGGVVVEDWNK